MSLQGPRSQYEWHIGSIAGIPVRLSAWYAIIAWITLASSGLKWGLVHLGVATFAILVHELGHAWPARRYRLKPKILLHGLGGWCEHEAPHRRQEHWNVVAGGPAAGFALSAVAFALSWLPIDNVLLSFVLYDLAWWNFWLNLLNVFPVLPLDGGQLFLLTQNRRADPERFVRRVSVWMGLALTVATLFWGRIGFALLFGLLAWQNAAAIGWVRAGWLGVNYQGSGGGYYRPPARAGATSSSPVRWALAGGVATIAALLWLLGPSAQGFVDGARLTGPGLRAGQIWRLMSWCLVDQPGQLVTPSLVAAALVMLTPPLERDFGWQRIGMAAVGGIGVVGAFAGAVSLVFGGSVLGGLPIVFGLLGAWSVRVNRAWLADVLPLRIQPELLGFVAVMLQLWGLWLGRNWALAVANFTALALGWWLAQEREMAVPEVDLEAPVPLGLEQKVDLRELLGDDSGR